jgi:hypothetical protein
MADQADLRCDPDFYRRVGASVHGIAPEAVTDEQRELVKRMVLAAAYVGGSVQHEDTKP